MNKQKQTRIFTTRDAFNLTIPFINTDEDRTINVSIKLNLISGKKKYSFNEVLALPEPIIKEVPKIGVFVDELNKENLPTENVIFAGSQELVKFVLDNKENLPFTHCVGTPKTLKDINSVKSILDLHGVLPTLRNGLIKPNIGELINQINSYGVRVKNDKNGYIHVSIGKTSFGVDKIEFNLKHLIDFLIINKPKGLKSNYILKSYLNINQLKSIPFIL